MGMFDYIEIHESFGLPAADEWQTKDTDCRLDAYKINEDRQLLRRKRGSEEWVAVPFRGCISFYTDINDVWYEYSALFDEGEMLNIKQIEPTKETP